MNKTPFQFDLLNSKLIIVFICLVALLQITKAQNYKETVFDFNDIEFAADIIKLEGEGFLLLGTTKSNGIWKNVFIHLDENGDTISTKITPGRGSSIVEFDSCYYIAGSLNNNGALFKLDKSFNPIWSKFFSDDYGYVSLIDIQKLSNIRLIYSYRVTPYDNSGPQYERVTYSDTSGIILWKTGQYYAVKKIEELSNGNLISTGIGFYNDPFSKVMNQDTLGNAKYSITPGEDYDIVGGSVTINDTTLLIVDVTNTGSIEDDFLKLFKINADSGNIIWEKQTFRGKTYSINTACRTVNDEIISAGRGKKDNKNAAIIFRLNFMGDSLSTSYIDKYYDLRPKKIISYNNYFYMIGTIFQENGTRDIYFLKAPLDTVLVRLNESLINEQISFKVYPNPTKDELYISIPNKENGLEYKLYNLNGQEIYKVHSKNCAIDVSQLRPGIYIVEFEYKEKKIRKKIIVK